MTIVVVKMGDAVVGDADGVNSVSASACHIGGPKGVTPGYYSSMQNNIFV